MSGNAELLKAMGRIGTLAGKVGQHLWPVLKPSIASGEIDLQKKFVTDAEVKAALRRGFLFEEVRKAADLGLNIGHVPKDELADLSVWDLKHLYSSFYLNAYGIYLGFPDELMPEAPDNFAWPVCVPGIISNEVAFQSGKIDIPRWKHTDDPLDSVIDPTRGRDAWLHSFIVRVRPNWEADEDMQNLSANDIENTKTNVIMLRERLILGTFLFWLTGDHLDHRTVTLSGSRCRGGFVPDVYFDSDDRKVSVDWAFPDHLYGILRSRQAVS